MTELTGRYVPRVSIMAALYSIAVLHVPGTPYASRVTRIATAFETIYDAFVYLPMPIIPRNDLPMWRIGASPADYLAAEAWASEEPGEGQELILPEVHESGSFDMSFWGIGDAIDATAEICDPARRRERKERLRHDQEMNQIAERQARLDTELKSLDLIERQIGLIQGMVEQGVVGAEAGNEMIRKLVDVQDEAGELIEGEGAVVELVREDEQRQIGR